MPSSALARLRNAARKVRAGLSLFGESVWPGTRIDVFVAHESIYRYFATLAADRRVLDAGCGAGYGAYLLAEAGARSVTGVDLDRRNIRYARRHYAHPCLSFAVADCERLELAPASLDLVVSSNVLEHLEHPAAFLDRAAAGLAASGTVVLAIPPITSARGLAEHNAIHFHRSNLEVDRWLELFAAGGWDAQVLAHRYPPGLPQPDFGSPHRSVLRSEDFFVEPSSRDALYDHPPITAIFSLTRRPA